LTKTISTYQQNKRRPAGNTDYTYLSRHAGMLHTLFFIQLSCGENQLFF
jgi:hypothetical protein